ncbi:aminodeoxychorismate synthase component I [Hephaestia sp. GCM10023244]|uniref:aminodeoxychorismate synthase component I n=1 Tax=unclassified Hephaestia TaxID=2631281 RepID=UPI0020772C44|nr:aminodeoxychorismate synthase component I [Hephaestia sp. MAHUQ-44]MCM8730955.1 aminodeoxychorismate synthase component I [Hephaestia sp. MAHUQ-44]
MLADAPPPFVLLDDAADGGATLYRAPVRVIAARQLADIRPALEALRAARGDGLHAAGYLAYGAGSGIEPRIAAVGDDRLLLWFGLFERAEAIAADRVAGLLPDPAAAWCAAPRPTISDADYAARFARVLDYIRAGDLYQANLTFAAEVAILGDPLALYARLRAQARAPYGAVVHTGDTLLLSLSPELFFRLDAGRLLARPMKGTAIRGDSEAEDRAITERLAADPKQRAENLMIVDLLRNDLTRVARPGSVKAPRLFAVETYPTIHQMVSDVAADLAEGRDAVDVIAALFPCGSITGAPKIRASEVIAEIEASPRGAYTGAIGRIGADGDAIFNVAIRTLDMVPGGATARLGLGSGVVADSNAAEEWAECLAKGAFVTAGQRRFDLIETMAFDPHAGIALLDRHLERLKASAQAFGITFDRHATRNELQAATFRLREARRIRLLLAPSGAIAIQISRLPAAPAGPVAVGIVPAPFAATDVRCRHKTSDRAAYDRPRTNAGTFEVAFVDAHGFLTEGSFSSLFVARGDTLVTPPLARGLLPGVLRAELIDTGRAIEGDLTPADLEGGFFIGNALRGLIPAVAVANEARL